MMYLFLFLGPRIRVEGGALVSETIPGARLLPFGHLGDGNLHFNMLQPEDMERGFLALRGYQPEPSRFG